MHTHWNDTGPPRTAGVSRERCGPGRPQGGPPRARGGQPTRAWAGLRKSPSSGGPPRAGGGQPSTLTVRLAEAL
ncbi:hypothetical protein B6264_30185 (plasmid) [Kitasatospora aureofaciens]|nr:hypothetical protein B6264_30185 [Kitasatospora aureofaciens]